MQIHIIIDSSSSAGPLLHAQVSGRVTEALAEVADKITHAEVHLSDDESATAGSPLCCLIEARLRGHQPMLVAHQAANVDSAVTGALGNLLQVMECAFARSRNQLNRYYQPPQRDPQLQPSAP